MSVFPQSASVAEKEATDRRRIVVNANYEIFVFAVTLLQLVNSLVWMLQREQQGTQIVVQVSGGISLFLLLDAAYRLWRASRASGHFLMIRSGLLVLGSLPIPFFVFFRLLWTGLMVRMLRRTDLTAMGDLVVEKRAQSTLLVAILAAVIMLELSTILILDAESQSPQANILDADDAVWWTIVTMATVGYGDKYPVTNAGRVIGVLVMVVGVGLFGVMTSFLAHWFLRSRQARDKETALAAAQAADTAALLAKLDALTALVEEQGRAHRHEVDDLRVRLAEIGQTPDDQAPTIER